MITRPLAVIAATALMLSGLAATATDARPRPKPTRTFDMSSQDAWTRVNRYLSANAIPVSAGPQAGTLIAKGDSRQGEFVKCRARKGELRSIGYDMVIVVENAARGDATVTVLVDGQAINARRNHLLFIPTTVRKTPIDCVTTGRFERELFAYLAAA